MTPADLLELTHADRAARLRGGGTCTAAELSTAVGPDTARYVLLRARPGSLPVLDPAVLSTATDANPAFLVRHAHARLCAIARQAAALGVDPAATPGQREPLEHPREIELRDLLTSVDDSEKPGHEAYRLTRGLEALAEAVARLEVCAPPLPKGDEPVTDRHRARVALCAAARAALARGLRRLDVTAPEQM